MPLQSNREPRPGNALHIARASNVTRVCYPFQGVRAGANPTELNQRAEMNSRVPTTVWLILRYGTILQTAIASSGGKRLTHAAGRRMANSLKLD
jgi:hypothetical protein